MRFILLISTLLLSLTGIAQHTLKGKVVDQRFNPVPYASVSLIDKLDSSRKWSVVSDTAGNFIFTGIGKGVYSLTASSTGYQTAFIPSVTVTDSLAQTLPLLILAGTSKELQSVIVKSKTPPVEVQQGKIIFNIQNLATTSGLTAFDLMKKLPGITIDQDEAITLRGAAGVNVLVDGKMSYLSGAQLTTFLKGISAEDINKIELNATPSAQYDAAGNAGIINIILKKSLKKGYAVDLRSGITKGKYWMPNANVSASLRAKALNLYASLDYKKPDAYQQSRSGNTINANGQRRLLERDGQSIIRVDYYTWRAGAEWRLSRRHQLSIDYLGYKDDWKNTKISAIDNLDADRNKTGSTATLYNNIEPYYYDAVNAGYRYTIDSTGSSITAEAHYINYRNYSDGRLATDLFNAAGQQTGSEVLLIHQPGFIKIRSANADASFRIKKLPVKTGLKYAEVENDNPYRFDSLQGNRFVPVEDISNHFNYKERIAAAYVMLSMKRKKTSLEAGLRYEYTRADGRTIKQDVNNRWEYGQLFPSLAIGREMGATDKIDLSVSRRINRPSYGDLNPIRWYVDPYFYYSGNPALVPELAWVFSAAYTLRHKYVLTATYNVSKNYISRSLTMDGDAVKSQSGNLGTMRRFDWMAALPLRLYSFWEMQLTPVISYMSYPIPQIGGTQTLDKWFATLTVQQRFNLPAQFKMDLSAQYYSPGLRGIYETASAFYADLGIRRSILGGRFDAQMTLSDLFNTNRYKGYSQSAVTNYYYRDKPDSRRIGITLHYHFGSDLIRGSGKRTEEQERL